jgi:hypothetical protein
MSTALARRLTHLFVYLGKDMLPEVPLTTRECEGCHVYLADAYEFKESRATRTAHVWSRVAGLGWVHLQLDAAPLREMAESILAMLGPASTPEQRH